MAFWNEPSNGCHEIFFPAEYDSGFKRGHGRIERHQLQRLAVDPESISLCGCWQIVAVLRHRQYLRKGKVYKEEQEYSYYCASLSQEEISIEAMNQLIKDHWGAIENGSHHRRDVSLGEDASQIKERERAQVMSTLRNLTLGLYELSKDKGKVGKDQSVPSWRRRMTGTMALGLVSR